MVLVAMRVDDSAFELLLAFEFRHVWELMVTIAKQDAVKCLQLFLAFTEDLRL